MYRIDNATATTPIPTPAAVGPNVDCFFTKGNPSLGIPATIVDDDWANAIQEEICNVITGAGITLSKTVRTQLLQAIEVLSQKDIAVYTTSTTAANTYTATMSPVPAAYTEGMFVAIKFTHGNTGSATINLNSLGAKTIHYLDGTALSSGAFADGQICFLMYDGTYFQLINPIIVPANYLTIANYQNNTPGYIADSGSANAYAATLSPAIVAYTAGLRLSVKIANTNTSQTCTLNVNGLGTKTIVPATTGALSVIWPGNMQAGQICHFAYDGTNFQLQNPYIDQDALKQPNLILGGDFGINPFQRSAGASIAAPTSGQFIADRFRWYKSGAGVVSSAQDGTLAPTVAQSGLYSAASLNVTVTTAAASPGVNDFYAVEYPMDGPTFGIYAQKAFTLSFWVYATVTGTYGLTCKNQGKDRSYIGTYTVNVSNTWEYKTVTVAATPSGGTWNYTSLAGMYITWYLAAGSSKQSGSTGSWQSSDLYAPSGQANNMATNGNKFNIDLVQLEPGLNATLFKSRDASAEVVALQRYFEKSWSFDSAVGTANTVGAVGVVEPATIASMFCGNQMTVTKRQSPTVTWYSTSTGASGNVRNTGTNADVAVTSNNFTGTKTQGSPNLASSVNDGVQVFAHWTAESEVS